MTEQFHVKSKFGVIVADIDPHASGFDALGRKRSGALVGIKLEELSSTRNGRLSAPAAAIREELQNYLSGDLKALDRIPVMYRGSEFQINVLRGMRRIPAGEVASYAELADLGGYSKAVRAAASVCASNKVPLVVPCHRVVRSDGSLGNYFYGVELKAALLAHEGAFES